jgi:hypothetical protein
VYRDAVGSLLPACVRVCVLNFPKLLTAVSLAMAEMTTLVATIYRRYHTSIATGFADKTPAITARVETFYDERFRAVQVSLIIWKSHDSL